MIRKFSNKIILAILLISVVTGLSIGYISLNKYKTSVTQESYSRLRYLVESYGKDFDSHIKFVEQYTALLHAITTSTFKIGETVSDQQIDNYENRIIPLLNEIAVQLHPVSYWIIFNPDYVKRGHTISFWDKNNNGHYEREKEYNVNHRDLKSKDMQWWVDALKNGSTWTNPYYWDNWDANLITYAQTYYDKGRAIAVLGSDINFNNLKKDIEKITLYKTGYFWIFNDQFDFIYHPKYINNNIINIESGKFRFIKDSIVQVGKQTGIIEYELGKQEKVMAYYKLHNGWILCVGIPKEEIFEELNKSAFYIGLITIGGILFSIIVGLLISKSITKPIDQLVKTIRIAAEGNLKVKTNITTNDELKELGNYLNYFLEKLEINIQELKDNEQKLIEAKNKAEESEKLKASFLANMSHEIRTPMNAIVGFTWLLQEETLSKQEISYYTTLVSSSCNNLLSLIDDILDISKMENGPVKLNYSLDKISSLLDEIVFIYNIEFEKYKHKETPLHFYSLIDPEINLLTFYFDKLRLKQIITNLINNAIKYTNSGTITFRCKKYNENYLLFYVRDTGIGIKKEDQELIFDRFRKVENKNREVIGGVGLGLAIVRELVALFKGKVWVESEIGKGSTFYFTIPIITNPEDIGPMEQ